MEQPAWIVGYRVAFALLAIAAMVTQFLMPAENSGFTPGNFFSFFTIQSNIIAVVVLLLVARRPAHESPSAMVDYLRGAAVLYMATTGVVYGLLLSGYQEQLQTTIPWVDTVLHRVMPLVMVADWLIDPPRTRLDLRRALPWLLFPVLYLVYSLVRGPIVDWYPYPFLNPDKVGGYAGVALYSVGIAVAVLLFAWLVVWAGQRVRLVAPASDLGRPPSA